jgi:uncharacterized membrane protein YphA (DoxX/SURF4 family)
VLGRSVDVRWLSLVGRLVVGAVFLVTALSKIGDIDGTIRTVRAYKILPEWIAPTFGTALPIVELCLAVLLLVGLMTRLAAILTIPLCLAFFVGISQAWARGLEIECGCFGNNGATAHPVPGYLRELVLNAVLIAVAVWLIRRPASQLSLDAALGLQLDDLTDLDDLDDPDLDDPDLDDPDFEDHRSPAPSKISAGRGRKSSSTGKGAKNSPQMVQRK